MGPPMKEKRFCSRCNGDGIDFAPNADRSGGFPETCRECRGSGRTDERFWTACPAAGVPAVKIGPMAGKCPACDFTFSTLMDDPITPRHWSSIDGEWVRVTAP